MMNEEMNQFERHLSRQPLRQVPAEWREEILSVASKVGTARRAVRGRLGEASLPQFRNWLLAMFWPNPQVWAGLAVIWILIFAVDFSMRDKTPAVAEKSSLPSPEVIAQLRQQQRFLAELMGPRDSGDADRPKSLAPRPRSECVEFWPREKAVETPRCGVRSARRAAPIGNRQIYERRQTQKHLEEIMERLARVTALDGVT